MAGYTSILRSSIPRSAILTGAFALIVSVASPGNQSPVSSLRDSGELVRKAVQNEIKAAADTAVPHFEFRGVKTTPKGSTTRIYIETKEATAGLVVAYDGKPLTSDQRKTEEARIEHIASHPDELKKKRDQEQANTEHTLRIMRALPEAFLYEYAGEGTVSDAGAGAKDGVVKLKFRPNPNYVPPSHVEEVLTAMKGEVMVDTVHYRLAGIDGTLYKEVGFGWGILGHLDRGGRFIVKQQDVGENVWEISSMTLNFNGKILLLKTLSINSTEVFSDFKPVPDLTFAQALDFLKKKELSVTAQTCCGTKGSAVK